MPKRRPSRRKAVDHFASLLDMIDEQARFLLQHRGSDPNVKKLDQWAIKARADLEKAAGQYFRIFDAIDIAIDGPATPRVPRR